MTGMADDTAWYEALADQVRETERERILEELMATDRTWWLNDWHVRLPRVIDIVKDQT